jgi:thiamine monophosphate kinase
VGARVVRALLPWNRELPDDGRSRLEHVLYDGEDFELLVAHERPRVNGLYEALERRGVYLLPIGSITEAGEGIVLQTATGDLAWPEGGWDHIGG